MRARDKDTRSPRYLNLQEKKRKKKKTKLEIPVAEPRPCTPRQNVRLRRRRSPVQKGCLERVKEENVPRAKMQGSFVGFRVRFLSQLADEISTLETLIVLLPLEKHIREAYIYRSFADLQVALYLPHVQPHAKATPDQQSPRIRAEEFISAPFLTRSEGLVLWRTFKTKAPGLHLSSSCHNPANRNILQTFQLEPIRLRSQGLFLSS
jgi:hypothetical protein